MSPVKAKRRHSLLITLPVAAGAIAYLWFVFLPNRTEIESLKQEIQAKVAVVTKGAQVRDSIAALQKDMDETTAFTADWNGQHAGSASAATMFGEVAATMKAAGVVTTQFTPEPPIDYAQLEKLPLKLQCRGTYTQLTDLVQKLESLPYRIWVDELQFEKSGKDGKELTCQLTLAIFTNKTGKSD